NTKEMVKQSSQRGVIVVVSQARNDVIGHQRANEQHSRIQGKSEPNQPRQPSIAIFIRDRYIKSERNTPRYETEDQGQWPHKLLTTRDRDKTNLGQDDQTCQQEHFAG